MNGPFHYRLAETLLEKAGISDMPRDESMYLVEMARAHAALAQVAATALNSDSGEWLEAISRPFAGGNPGPD
jgi:hypothetical protein